MTPVDWLYTTVFLASVYGLIASWPWCFLPWVDCSDHHVELYCPRFDDERVVATEYTQAIGVECDTMGGNVWIYDCEHCANNHRFLWGPPAPVYVGDDNE